MHIAGPDSNSQVSNIVIFFWNDWKATTWYPSWQDQTPIFPCLGQFIYTGVVSFGSCACSCIECSSLGFSPYSINLQTVWIIIKQDRVRASMWNLLTQYFLPQWRSEHTSLVEPSWGLKPLHWVCLLSVFTQESNSCTEVNVFHIFSLGVYAWK